jgi:hypothetical protein
MNNRNQQTNHTPAPAAAPSPTYLNVFTVEEYENNGKTGKKWTKIGAAFPHKEGLGSERVNGCETHLFTSLTSKWVCRAVWRFPFWVD